MTRRYAQFDEIAIGAGLVLTQGDAIVSTSGTVDIHRHARSNFPMDLFQGGVECVFFGTGTLAAGKVRLGVVTTDADLAKAAGEDVYGWGWDPFDGKLYHNNAVVATIGTAVFGDIVVMFVDPVAGSLVFERNKAVIGTYALPAAGSYFYAATTSGAPGNFSIYANAGQSRFQSDNPSGGWWVSPDTVAPFYLATEGFTTDPDDAIPHLQFQRAINVDNAFIVSCGIQVWMWGASMPSQLSAGPSSITVTLNDPTQSLEPLITEDVRDLPAKLRRTQRGARYDDAEAVFTGVIDRCEPTSDNVKSLVLKGLSATIQRALQTSLFPPNVDPTVANTPRPVLIGPDRNFTPDVFDTVAKAYALNDRPVSAMGNVRVAGKPLTYPTDYTLTADRTGIVLAADPAGKFTVECTSIGPGFDAAAPDFLAGAGIFADTNGDHVPDGWDITFRTTSDIYDTPARYRAGFGAFFPQWYQHQSSITLPSKTLGSGRSYAYKIVVSDSAAVCLTGGGPDDSGYPTLCICGGDYVGTSTAPHLAYQFGFKRIQVTAPGIYTGVFTNTSGTDQILGLVVFNNATTSTSYPALNDVSVSLTSIVLNELPDVGANVPLQAATLEQMCTELLEVRGGLPATAWSHADAAAIDAATAAEMGTSTGYTIGKRYGSTEIPTIGEAFQEALHNFTAGYFEDRAGVLRIARWVAPETVAEGDRFPPLLAADLLNDLLPYDDYAENLATRMLGCPNGDPYTDGDFGDTDLTDCPAAVRTQLKAQFQWSAPSGLYLSPCYSAATGNARATWFDELKFGIAEINRVCRAYGVKRRFFVGKYKAPPGSNFLPGQVRVLTYPLHGLAAGKPVFICGVTEDDQAEEATIVSWG